jgi:hypothetical protein
MFPVLETLVRVVTCITAGGRKLFSKYFSAGSPWPGNKMKRAHVYRRKLRPCFQDLVVSVLRQDESLKAY